MYEIILVLMVALIASFIILFITKIGLRAKVIERSKVKKISQMFECDFCLSFWVAVALSIVVALMGSDVRALLIPILSTPITRILI